MTDLQTIQPLPRPVDAVVHLPGSKSITNRALILAALASGESRIEGALFSDDTRHMADCLNRLGIGVEGDEADRSFTVHGAGGRLPASEAELFTGNSGTTMRFVTALAALGHGRYRLDGVARMRERPIQDLLAALNVIGCAGTRFTSEQGTGCPPVIAEARGLCGGRVTMRGDVSSQFLSAVLMVGPASRQGIEVKIRGELSSKPYVEMTLAMMRQWGATVSRLGEGHIQIPVGNYRPRAYAVEPDASAASYFFAAAAVTGSRIRVEGLGVDSLQGDTAFVDILGRMGCEVERGDRFIQVRGTGRLRGIDVDMNPISDTVMTLAAIAPFAESPTIVRNIAHIRHKETDRIQALAAELRRLGVRVDEREDGLTIYPAQEIRPARIETYADHRMAMSFAITGLRAPGIQIRDPACVAKTFPDFFDRLERLRACPSPLL